jgi:hypothetical protein
MSDSFEGDDPDSKGYPGPPGWGLRGRLTTPPRKTTLLSRNLKEKGGGLIPSRDVQPVEEEEEEEEEEKKEDEEGGGGVED